VWLVVVNKTYALSKAAVNSGIRVKGKGGVYGSRGENCKMITPLVQVSLASKQDSPKFISMVERMTKEFEPEYNVSSSHTNCRGYVLRHIPTVCKLYDVSEADRAAAIKFIETIKQEDIELVAGSAVSALTGCLLLSSASYASTR
jgi:hypothetical protein